jgi:hypothetical protein
VASKRRRTEARLHVDDPLLRIALRVALQQLTAHLFQRTAVHCDAKRITAALETCKMFVQLEGSTKKHLGNIVDATRIVEPEIGHGNDGLLCVDKLSVDVERSSSGAVSTTKQTKHFERALR